MTFNAIIHVNLTFLCFSVVTYLILCCTTGFIPYGPPRCTTGVGVRYGGYTLIKLELMVALIYSGAVLITFIFVVMTFDQSDILCIPSYKFIPLLVLYIEGFIP